MFTRDQQYTRATIRQMLGVEGSKGGNWDTGHTRFNGEHFIFCNIDIPGRTGHNYNNFFDGDQLVWHPKDAAKLQHPVFAELVSGAERVHVFFRMGDYDPFTYAGLGTPLSVQEGTPIEVRWSFLDENTYPDEVSKPAEVFEGAKKQVTVNAYERNPTAKPRCLKRWGTICVVCGFDFSAVYGDLGQGFIHVHHLNPIHTIGEQYELDPEEDLRPVCPNCHAMLHRKKVVLSIDELMKLLRLRFNEVYTAT